ncbi:hypothetical protein MKW98_019562 [Papaver atlanticum]|uniref:Uncharacterized protein n=1 Tax=Papaver atlanticum TaxID=357466 RepID=A0AAD4S928_9MAGN|nr:hypothetical protein MKW98_019562 [Papaver atlanticum]
MFFSSIYRLCAYRNNNFQINVGSLVVVIEGPYSSVVERQSCKLEITAPRLLLHQIISCISRSHYTLLSNGIHQLLQVQPYNLSRMQKKIKEMTELVKNYPVFDPENESVQDIMDARIKKEDSALRLKFKPIASTFKIKLEGHGEIL